MKKSLLIALAAATIATLATLATTIPASARNNCDGFHRCRCGVTAARNFGIPYAFKGFNLKMAWEWARAFPHTSFRPGVAGVKRHHVLQVVNGSSCARATVRDERGTYQRNVCGMIFVAVNG